MNRYVPDEDLQHLARAADRTPPHVRPAAAQGIAAVILTRITHHDTPGDIRHRREQLTTATRRTREARETCPATQPQNCNPASGSSGSGSSAASQCPPPAS